MALVTVLSALTLYEFYGMTAKMGARPFRWMGLGFSVLITAAPYVLAYYTDEPDIISSVPVALLVLALIVSCIQRAGRTRHLEPHRDHRRHRHGPAVCALHAALPRRDPDARRLRGENLALCLWTVAVSKFCDVGALLTGLAIGKHKMSPTISPKKTWEGAVGGVLVSAGVGAGIAYFASAHFSSSLTPRSSRP